MKDPYASLPLRPLVCAAGIAPLTPGNCAMTQPPNDGNRKTSKTKNNGQVTDNTVTWDANCPKRSTLEKTEKMKIRRSVSPIQQPHVKRGSYDSELMRVLRERDKIQSILEKNKSHLSEMQANVQVLKAERDKTRSSYQQAQEEIAGLQCELLRLMTSQGFNRHSSTMQNILKQLETKKEEAKSDLHCMSTDRGCLEEKFKIFQENAIHEKAHLLQRVEDLQNALLTLEQERGEQKSREEHMMGLEEQVNILRRMLATAEGEVRMLRVSNTETEKTLLQAQKLLAKKIDDVQKIQEKSQQLDERNKSLLKDVTVLKERLDVLQNTVSELHQHQDTLQEQLKRKNDLLYCTNKELNEKKTFIHNKNLKIDELETALEAVKETVSNRDRELDVMKIKLLEKESELNSVLKLKDATVRDNTQLRDELDQVRLDNKDLQFKVDESVYEIELLETKVQTFESDIASITVLLSTKERECKELQKCWKELRSLDSENHKLKEKVKNLERRLQEALGTEQSCSAELKNLKSTLEKQEQDLRQMQSHNDWEKTCDYCVQMETDKEAALQELESCCSELELLRRQLAIEKEKDLQRELSDQERLDELQVLRDKVSVAERYKTSNAYLRTLAELLEADLEATRKQLKTEREERIRAVEEQLRLGLSTQFSSQTFPTRLAAPSPASHTSSSLEDSHPDTPDHLSERSSPDRHLYY